jgi:hypothetical protein
MDFGLQRYLDLVRRLVSCRQVWLVMLATVLAACGNNHGSSDAAVDAKNAPVPDRNRPREGGPAKLTVDESNVLLFVRPSVDFARMIVNNSGQTSTGPLSVSLSGPSAGDLHLEMAEDPIAGDGFRVLELTWSAVDAAAEPEPGTRATVRVTVIDTGPSASSVTIDVSIIFFAASHGLTIVGRPDFGKATIDAGSASRDFLVTNNSLSDSAPLSVSISSPEFAKQADSCSQKSLTGGGACSVSIAFAPAGPGQRLAVLTVRDANGSIASMILEGNGGGE